MTARHQTRARDAARLLGLILVTLPGGALAMRAPSEPHETGTIPADVMPRQLEGVGVEEHLGRQLPLDVKLLDHEGRMVQLGDYFGRGRPVIVNLGYYGCPMLCGFVINGLLEGVRELGWVPGTEFDVVTVSIDPRETTELAAGKRASVLDAVGKPGAEKGWAFHTGSEREVKRLAESLGFGYRWDPAARQFSHAAVIFIASPDGKISRYLYGITFPARDLKLALLDASEGKVGTTVDRLLLFCFHYDESSGRYVLFARNFMKVGGVITLVALSAFLFVVRRKHRTAGA